MKFNWRTSMIHYMKVNYAEAYERWHLTCWNDDRDLFCGWYRWTINGLETVDDNAHLFVKTAVEAKWRETRNSMDEILERFKDR